MKILGIETSADETAASIVQDGYLMLGNIVASSMDLHAAYGGMVPEIAARSHIEAMTPVIDQCMDQANCTWDDIDAIAVTQGPGLSGSLLIGNLTARTLAIAFNKPIYGVNHLAAHIYANFITSVGSALTGQYKLPAQQPTFPLLALIASGGHTQIVWQKTPADYQVIGQTRDDAVGEAFDKVAQILGLPYPGGPSVAAAALSGDPLAVKLPQTQLDNPYDFSFSGLKTAVLRAAQAQCGKDYTLPSSQLPDLLTQAQKNNLAASFQSRAITTLVSALKQASEEYVPATVVIAGGVAANQLLRQTIDKEMFGNVVFTDIKLCTDNAAMVATVAYHRSKQGIAADDPYQMAINPGLVR